MAIYTDQEIDGNLINNNSNKKELIEQIKEFISKD